jgi:golgi-specific brefeldin A-resistance guanine nucleotide exchange factor 1
MPADALEPLVRALLSQLPEDPSSTIITVKSDSLAPMVPNGQDSMSEGPVYDPSIVYILELCTALALRDHKTIKKLGEDVADSLQSVIRDSANYHSTMISRAVFYLLSLLHASYVSTISSCSVVCN